MALFLLLETSSVVCSVALAKDGDILSIRESREEKSHAAWLTVFIDDILDEQNIRAADLDAVVVSKGPGSYTGLRIGVSTAKGLCYAMDKPLIAINTLDALASGVKKEKLEAAPDDYFLCPLIDARRMEVYSAIFDKNLQKVQEVKAQVIDENSYGGYRDKDQPFYIFGDGAAKVAEVLKGENVNHLPEIVPSARYLLEPAMQKYRQKAFEDVAYFEPYYLKDFIATTPKKNIFH